MKIIIKNHCMKKNYLLILFLLFSFNSIAQNIWTQRADIGGMGRRSPYGFCIANEGYVGGGSFNGLNQKDFWKYDPLMNSWAQMNDAPSPVRAACSFVINANGYVTGGIQDSGTFNGQLWMYDPVVNSWSQKAHYPGTSIYGLAGFAIGNFGYAGIGNGGSATGPYYTELYQYNPITDNWIQKASFPGTSRYGTYGISLGAKGYVGFGASDALGISFNDWWEYDAATDSWSPKLNYPGIARAYTTGFALNGKIYIGTGGSLGNAYKDFYEYDPFTDIWTQRANYGGGNRWTTVGFAIGNKGYFGAGYTLINDTNDFWEYSSPTGIFENLNSYFDVKVYSISGNIKIEFSKAFHQNFGFEIFNACGKLVYSKSINTGCSFYQMKSNFLNEKIYFYEIVFNDTVSKSGKLFLMN